MEKNGKTIYRINHVILYKVYLYVAYKVMPFFSIFQRGWTLCNKPKVSIRNWQHLFASEFLFELLTMKAYLSDYKINFIAKCVFGCSYTSYTSPRNINSTLNNFIYVEATKNRLKYFHRIFQNFENDVFFPLFLNFVFIYNII